MVVLVNGNSASASKSWPAACKICSLTHAIIVGEQTFGKGSVQSILPLSDGSALRLTTAKYYTPSHKVIHQHGITPDIVVPMSEEDEQNLTYKHMPGAMEVLEAKEREQVASVRDRQLDRAMDLLKGILLYAQRSPVEFRVDPPRRVAAADEVVAPVVKLALADGRAAIGYVRKHSGEFGINPERIGMIGFSAGGALAVSAAMNYTTETRPNFVAPIYPAYHWAIKGSSVPPDAPPAFILAASDDELGLAPQSVTIYQDWIAAGKPAELHLYSKGGHGFGMRQQLLPSDHWIERFADWLDVQGLLK
jgi:predicted esterase